MLFYIFLLFHFGSVKVSNFKLKMLGIKNDSGNVEKCNNFKDLEKDSTNKKTTDKYSVVVTLFPLM